jgi:hypothetical protein
MIATRHHLKGAPPVASISPRVRLKVKPQALGRARARAQVHSKAIINTRRVESRAPLGRGVMGSNSHRNREVMGLQHLDRLVVDLVDPVDPVDPVGQGDIRLRPKGGSKAHIDSVAIMIGTVTASEGCPRGSHSSTTILTVFYLF